MAGIGASAKTSEGYVWLRIKGLEYHTTLIEYHVRHLTSTGIDGLGLTLTHRRTSKACREVAIKYTINMDWGRRQIAPWAYRIHGSTPTHRHKGRDCIDWTTILDKGKRVGNFLHGHNTTRSLKNRYTNMGIKNKEEEIGGGGASSSKMRRTS